MFKLRRELYIKIYLVMKKISPIIILLILQLFASETLVAKKIDNARIKMLNGEYAKLSDFNSNGPMIINFWTTW